MTLQLIKKSPHSSVLRPAQQIVIFLGMDYAVSLGMVRLAGRAGYYVCGIDEMEKAVSATSRYCKSYSMAEFSEHTAESLISEFCDLAQKPWLIATTDKWLEFQHQYQDKFNDAFCTFPLPKDKGFLSKKWMKHQAQMASVPVPELYENISDPSLPGASAIIVKPKDSLNLTKSSFDIISNLDDKHRFLESLERRGLTQEDFVFEEYLTGPDSNVWEAIIFADRKHQATVLAQFFKHRVYPPKYGSSSFIETSWNDEIAEYASTLCLSMELTGFLDFEFKIDCNNTPRFIEVNVRAGAPISLLLEKEPSCFKDLLDSFALCSSISPRKSKIPSGIFWMNDEKDWLTCKHGTVKFSKWLKDMYNSDYFALYHSKDLLPFLTKIWRIFATRLRGKLETMR